MLSVAGLIPDEVIVLSNLLNPSSRTVVLGLKAANRNEYQESSQG
jgi:hypothetical protein